MTRPSLRGSFPFATSSRTGRFASCVPRLAALSVAIFAIFAIFATACTSFNGRFPVAPSVPMTVDAVQDAALLGKTSWEPIPLQLRTGAGIRTLDVVGDTIYVLDTDDVVHAINAATGTHRWILKLDRTPTRPVAVGGGYVAFLSRNNLTVATGGTGTVVLRKDLEFTPSSNAALTLDSLYAGAWGKGTKLRAVSLLDGWNGWFYATGAPVLSAPVAVGAGADEMIYFASQDGSVVALAPEPAAGAAPTREGWKTRTLGKNSADLAFDDQSIFVASEDHALYCLNRTSGVIRWKWLDANVPLSHKPVVTEDTVYQPFAGVVAALDKSSGAEKYRVAGAERFLTRVGQRDYLKLEGDAILVVDATTGKKLSTLHSPLLQFLPSNPSGGALILSDGQTIYSLQ